VLIKQIFRLHCAALNMTVSDCHPIKFNPSGNVISIDEGLRNLLKEEFEMLKNKKTISV